MAMQNLFNYNRPQNIPTTINKDKKISVAKENKMKDHKQDSYLEQKIMMAKPEELTLMLYEGMVKFLKQAILYNDQNNIQKTHNVIIRAQNIITELNATLDEAYEISKNLSDMYTFMKSHLVEANIDKDSGKIAEVLELAEELRDTWKQAMIIR